MELNLASQSDFAKLADVLWLKGLESVPQQAKESGLFRVVDIPQNTGNTREFSEIDGQEYASLKDEGDQAARAQVQQGLVKIALYKFLLINGENLKTAIKQFMATLSKQTSVVQLQRLSEETL